MGKAARKMKKKQMQAEETAVRQENAHWEALLAEQMAAGEYTTAIDTLAKLIQGNDIQPEFMYDAAYAYFMVGDYERAGQWINNTLSYAPDHLSIRILLARLLMIEEREDDGLAVLEFVLDKGGDSLTAAQRKEIGETLTFLGDDARAKLRDEYPHVAAFLRWDASASETRDVSQILANLREKVAAVGAAAGEAVEEAAAAVKPMAEAGMAAAEEAVAAAKPTFEAGAAAVAKKPAEILASLKERLAAVRQGKKAPTAVEDGGEPRTTAEEAHGTGETPSCRESAAPHEETAQKTVQVLSDTSAAEQKKQDVLEKALPAVQKAELLTAFAAGYYAQGALSAAELLLQAALDLDAADGILRNMALVQQDLGRREEALQTAARMKLADFALLRLLRQG
ncbi:MAG: tetratricopeptide repeat protein [Schwartzia sp. (in: firmicutes)]